MQESLQDAVSLTLAEGYQLDKEAFDFLKALSQTSDPVKLIKKTIERIAPLPDKPLFISRVLLEETVEDVSPKVEKPKVTSPSLKGNKIFRAYTEGVDAEITVVEDPTDKLCGKGDVEEYLDYFRDRFRRIQKLLRQRTDGKDSMPISAALKASVKSKVKIIGMITEKREYNQKLFLRIEDLEASATVLVSSGVAPEVLKRAQTLLLDQVICVMAVKGKGNLLIAKDFVFPDIPRRKPRKAAVPVCAALLSDLHVGSKLFMHKALTRFILWLQGNFGNQNLRKMAGQVKYVVIAGDLVDGIGVYPNQIQELEIIDIYEQYRAAATFLEKIPDYIEVIVIPGNHDASRKALPQPALPKAYAEPVYEARKTHSFGNPSIVQLHGVEFLLFHGRSLDDLVATVPNIGLQMPHKAMKYLLQSRHLTPIYGERTPIAPEKRDYMVIERVPDIFHAGHVHILKYDTYRGTLMVNSGTWQEQTGYQNRMGLTPTPGIVPIVNLQTFQVTPINFVAD